jgi:hypothetical protein
MPDEFKLDTTISTVEAYRRYIHTKHYAKWKHGLTNNGYVRITVNKKRILEHVHVMQKHLGRQMQKGETIHHIDMEKTNNELSNLYLFDSQSEHQSCHISMERCGFGLLGKLIWFDWDKKEYVLNPTNPVIRKVKMPDVKIFQMQNGSYGGIYWFYSSKNEYGGFRSRTYHSLVAEMIIGRALFKNECVHHVDGDTLNSDPNNLCVVKRVEHNALCHCSLQKAVAVILKKGIVSFGSGKYFLKGEKS